MTLTLPQVTVAHEREEEDGEVLLEDPTLTLKSRQEGFRIEFQIPRSLKLVTLFSLRCHLRQDFTYGDRRLEMQLQLHTNTILMPLTVGPLQWNANCYV